VKRRTHMQAGAVLVALVIAMAIGAPAGGASPVARSAAKACTWSTWTIYKRHHVTCAVARRALKLSRTTTGPTAFYCTKKPSGGVCSSVLTSGQSFRYRRTG
jgi:hypothetical protein